ncbi:MAG: CPBP family intramembrane metalloprotease [Gammaproteobacteria bacterium]|nr:CPBP family intramembrane metalloprotease [Gammaproteobacteria bacterium]
MKESELKVWHLVLFNIFFDFIGGFVALNMGNAEILQNIIKICTSMLLISFLIVFIPDIKKFIFPRYNRNSLFAISLGFILGILMWYTMVLFMPLIQLLLDNCSLGFCDDLLQNYYSIKTSGSFLDLNREVLVTMVVIFVIIGPIREEILYRAAMGVVLYKRYSLVGCSIIVALVFSLFHLRHSVFTFAFSLLLSALLLKYRSIWPGAIAHGTYNCMIYFLFPSKDIIGHYTNLSNFDVFLAIFLLVNTCFWSIYSIKRSSVDWLELSHNHQMSKSC